MRWEYLREEEFEPAIARVGGLCVLPIGCLEKHGQHLPMGTDYFEATDICYAANEAEEVVIFPTGAWLGEVSCFHAIKDPHAAKLSGCIGIKQELLLNILSELCDEIYRNGFRKILLVNGHGGNTAMLRHFLRMQTYEEKPYATLMTSAFAFRDIDPKRLINTVRTRKKDFSYLTDDDMKTLERFSKSGTGGGHADIRETSLVMVHDERLVAVDKYEAECGLSNHRTDHLDELGIESANSWLASHPASYEAYPPHGASKAIGKAMLTVCAERLAKIFKTIKEDEDCVRSAALLPKTE